MRERIFAGGVLLLLLCAGLACGAETAVRDGRIEVDGQRFFPLGLYHVSFYGSRERKLADLKEVAAGGFNLMDLSLDQRDGPLLEAAAKAGIYVLPEFNGEPHALMRQFKNSAAIFGWSIADDADSGRHTPEQIAAKDANAKKIDPAHLTYISCGIRSAPFVKSADVVAVQVYPVGSSGLGADPLELVFKHIDEAVRAAAPVGRPVIANVQCGRVYRGARAPAIADVRNMSYQALVAGARGILYYTYFDGLWDMRTQPELWAGMKALAGELKENAPVWLNGKRAPLVTGEKALLAAQWRDGGGALVVVVNTARRRIDAKVDVPELAEFSVAATDWTLQSGKLVGTLEPLAVRILSLAPKAGE